MRALPRARHAWRPWDVFSCSNRGRWTESLLSYVHLPLVLPLNPPLVGGGGLFFKDTEPSPLRDSFSVRQQGGLPWTAESIDSQRATWAGGEANLLSENMETAEANGAFESFASFENTLMTLGDPAHEYQCVWNAAGITDNRALAGGVSESLFPPADVYEDGARGTKACLSRLAPRQQKQQ